MRFLVVYFSHTGNNRLLAEEIARRLDCDLCAIVEKRRRTMLTIILDMLLRRLPRIEPLVKALSGYDHVVFVAPVWDSRVASPMQALIKRERGNIPRYSFITLCGQRREGQHRGIEEQLAALAGMPPVTVQELRVSALLPPERRNEIKAVSGYRVSGDELNAFESDMAAFLEQVRTGS